MEVPKHPREGSLWGAMKASLRDIGVLCTVKCEGTSSDVNSSLKKIVGSVW